MDVEEYEQRQQRHSVQHDEDYVPLESQCVECGEEESGRCSCCGSPLCMMHNEVQAGFCSNFGTYQVEGEEVTGCKHGEEIHEMQEPDWEQEEVPK